MLVSTLNVALLVMCPNMQFHMDKCERHSRIFAIVVISAFPSVVMSVTELKRGWFGLFTYLK